MKAHTWGRRWVPASTLPAEEFASLTKKNPETVCSPDQNPGAIFTFCLKLIQSDLSNANSQERNSHGLLGKVYMFFFPLKK